MPGRLSSGNDVDRMNDTWNVTQNGQNDIKEKGTTASNLKENTQRRKNNGENDFDDVCANHGESICLFTYMRELGLSYIRSSRAP